MGVMAEEMAGQMIIFNDTSLQVSLFNSPAVQLFAVDSRPTFRLKLPQDHEVRRSLTAVLWTKMRLSPCMPEPSEARWY